VLVLEPAQALGPAEDRNELAGVPFPGRDPALLLRVLGARLEDEAHPDARHGGEQLASHRFELGTDAALDRFHAGLEAGDIEHLEVGRREAAERHAGASFYSGSYTVSGSSGKMGRRTRRYSKRARLDEDSPGA